MIEDAIYTRLAAVTGVTDLVSTRIYPELAPESPTYPLVVFRIISQTNYPAMGADVGVKKRRVQVDCIDKTATGARTLGEAVESALNRYSGTVTYSGGSTVIDGIYLDNIIDLFDEHARTVQRAVDFIVMYQG